jgi:hypothetical protein
MKIKITNAKKVKIEKGDLLIFEVNYTAPKPIFDAWAERFIKFIKELYPDIKILVLPKEIKLKKIIHKKEK